MGLDGNLAVVAGLERRAHRARQVVPHAVVVVALERLAQVVPGARARKERLRQILFSAY